MKVPYAEVVFKFFEEQADSPRSSCIPSLGYCSVLLILLFAGPWWFRGFKWILPLLIGLLLPRAD